MDQALYNLLLASFDRTLSDEEQVTLNQGLETSGALREEKTKLLKLREIIGEQSYEFEPFFVGRAMHRIESLGKRRQSDKGLSSLLVRIFPKVALSGLAIILLLVVGTYFIEGSFSLDTLLGISGVAAEDAEYYLMENF